MIILLRIVCTVRITSPELPTMAKQNTGHVIQTETRDDDTALPLVEVLFLRHGRFITVPLKP